MPRTLIAGFFIALMLGTGALFVFSTDSVAAQPLRPTRARETPQPLPRETREPSSIDASTQPTREATFDLDQRTTEIAATADYYATVSGESAQSAQATATAISNTLTDLAEDVAEQVEILAQYFTLNGTTNYDSATGILSVSVVIDEANVNATLEEVQLDAGYSVDFDDATGTIFITVEEVELSNGVTATVTLGYQPVITEDGVILVLVSATVNGHSIPPDAIDETITQAVSIALDSVALDLEAMVEAYSGDFDYTVDLIVVTDDTITVAMTIYVPV